MCFIEMDVKEGRVLYRTGEKELTFQGSIMFC